VLDDILCACAAACHRRGRALVAARGGDKYSVDAKLGKEF